MVQAIQIKPDFTPVPRGRDGRVVTDHARNTASCYLPDVSNMYDPTAPGSESVALSDRARSPCYLATMLADGGRWTMILCRSRNGGCGGSQVRVAGLQMFVYILLE